MNKSIFVILIAIIATLISVFFQYYMRGREVTPALKRRLRFLFIAGVTTLVAALILIAAV